MVYRPLTVRACLTHINSLRFSPNVGSAGVPAEFGPSRLNGTSVIKEIRLII